MLKILGDRVLIKIKNNENITSSGIILLNNENEKPQTAEIIGIGNNNIGVEIGNLVLVKKNEGIKLNNDEEEYIINQKDILAIIE